MGGTHRLTTVPTAPFPRIVGALPAWWSKRSEADFNAIGLSHLQSRRLDDCRAQEPGVPGSASGLLGPECARIVRHSQMTGCSASTVFITHSRGVGLLVRDTRPSRPTWPWPTADAVDAYFAGEQPGPPPPPPRTNSPPASFAAKNGRSDLHRSIVRLFSPGLDEALLAPAPCRKTHPLPAARDSGRNFSPMALALPQIEPLRASLQRHASSTTTRR